MLKIISLCYLILLFPYLFIYLFIFIFFFFFFFFSFEEYGTEHQLKKSIIPEFRPIGCFRDRGRRPRPIPVSIASFRGRIDWSNLNNTIAECARRVNSRGFHYFGVQFYGECWSGKIAHLTYNKQGISENCIYGVGKKNANFVYAFVEKGTFSLAFFTNE